MLQHECNKHQATNLICKNKYCFVFFLYYISCEELNVGENFKNYGKSFFKVSSYSHPEI
jgi:hypothetical protein